ncbi:hypothetical protein M4I32_07210 [Microbacterium sp. LRZ72]|uniref:hypothetical protein n=1 Tax=Microbacterium sp. LRZ72 TaxID=2942481 RepID=UPI0029ACEBF4|nr:hypothetical protein [Microbacterium sp. LRZ72]MDX2376586.1 hypothetical protein [Microbacterium sp. LRZ72]
MTLIDGRRDHETRPDPGGHLDAIKYWLVLVAFTAGAFIAWRSHAILPPKLFLDEFIIRRFISGELQSDGPSSYGTTGWLYRVTGLGSIPDLFPLLAFLVFAGAIVVGVGWRNIAGMSFPAIGLTAGSLLLGGVYLSQYSKEFFVLPLAILLLLARRSWKLEVAWLALALLYATHVRQYWFLVIAIYLALRFVIPALRSAWWLVPIVLVGFLVMVIVFEVFLGTSLTFFRTDINNALEYDRSTQIDDVLPGDAIPVQWLNGVLVMLWMAFPVWMIFSGDLVQLLAGVFMAVCWVLVIDRARFVVGRAGPGVLPLAFLIAFLMVQTAFEPDYGSYLRHITPQLPIFLALFAATARRGRDEHRPVATSPAPAGQGVLR